MNAELQRQHAAHLERRARLWAPKTAAIALPAVTPVERLPWAPPVVEEMTQQGAEARKPLFSQADGVEARYVLYTSHPKVRSIARAVAAYFDMPPETAFVRRRHDRIVRVRNIAIAVTKSRTDWSLPRLGQRFGLDHTTVLHAIRRANRDAVAAVCALLDEVRG